MDSQQRTIGHIDGIEGTNIPLIVDTTAYWEFAAKYAGKKYIAYQKANYKHLLFTATEGPRGANSIWPQFNTVIEKLYIIHKIFHEREPVQDYSF